MTIQYIQNNLKYKNSITYTISEKKSRIHGLWGGHLIGYTLKAYATIMRYYHLEILLQMSVSDIPPKNIKKKKEERHRITQFKNCYSSKKTPMNADCDRADSRFTNPTKCRKKCNIFNDMITQYYLCEN